MASSLVSKARQICDCMSPELVHPIRGSISRGISGSYSSIHSLVRAEPDCIAVWPGVKMRATIFPMLAWRKHECMGGTRHPYVKAVVWPRAGPGVAALRGLLPRSRAKHAIGSWRERAVDDGARICPVEPLAVRVSGRARQPRGDEGIRHRRGRVSAQDGGGRKYGECLGQVAGAPIEQARLMQQGLDTGKMRFEVGIPTRGPAEIVHDDL